MKKKYNMHYHDYQNWILYVKSWKREIWFQSHDKKEDLDEKHTNMMKIQEIINNKKWNRYNLLCIHIM